MFETHAWHWLFLGLIFLLFAMVLSARWLSWPACGAAGAGVLKILSPQASPGMLAAAFTAVGATVAVSSVLWGRGDPQRALEHRGRTTVLTRPIRRGRGKVRLDGEIWKVRGPEMPRGATVRVVSAQNAVLIVEPCLEIADV